MTAPMFAVVSAAVLAAAFGYLLGSIPFGFVLSRLAGLGDIRAVGSGNIGATNVLRTGRKDIAALTLLLDGGKGTAAVVLATVLAGWLAGPSAGLVAGLVAGVAAVLGHCTTPWMGWRGGKGVATGLGTVFGWAWPVGLLCCAAWLATAFVTKRSSAAGLAAFVLAPVSMLVLRPWPMALAALLVSALIIVRHHGNIRRLLAGTEPRIGART